MATTKKTMTLNLTDAEMAVLDALCEKKELSKTSLIRQALRLYQVIDLRLERGDKLFFEDDKTKDKAEVVML
jgi:predicted transcriptional regulator|nr:ribbon-helix-helix protein, CopG family [Luteibacter rhizovicinus]